MPIAITLPEIKSMYTKSKDYYYFYDFDDIGTVEFDDSDKTKVHGSGTTFLTDVNVGDWIVNYTDDRADAEVERLSSVVASIESDTELTLNIAYEGATGTGKTCRRFKCLNNIDITFDAINITGV